MKNTIIKLISTLLLLCMFSFSLSSCFAEFTEGDNGTQTNGIQNETPNETPTEAPNETDAKGTMTVFKNGAYAAKIIRAELATDTEKTAYNRVKAAFKSKTGKSVTTTTDFVAAGASLDDSSAILVGETAYEESKNVYKSLGKGEAIATLVGNKYVIAFSNTESLIKLLAKLEEKVSTTDAEEIVIDSTWEINIKPTVSADAIELPEFDGKALGTAIDLGQGSSLYIMSDATLQKYIKYTEDLEGLGFEFYATNNIAGNEYSTFITKSQIVNVMFLKNLNEVRIIEDSRDSIDLPGLKSENVYTKTSTPSFTMMGISDAGYPGGMSFIYKLSDGTFFIIDGGMCANRTGSNECSGDPSVNRLFKTLQSLADDPDKIVISGWLITHIHNDHAGAFIDLAEKSNYLSKITIKKVIYSQPADSDMTDGNQPKRLTWMPDALAKMKISKTVKAHPGQVFYFADLKLTILGCHDLIKPTKISRHNNASIVSMVEFGGKTALYLADAEGDSNAKLEKLYGSELNADILQVAHHGYNNTNAGIVYKYITPSIVLWPIQTSDWKSGDNVYNISFNKQYFDKSNIKHYVGGAANTTFENLTTWLPTRVNWKP